MLVDFDATCGGRLILMLVAVDKMLQLDSRLINLSHRNVVCVYYGRMPQDCLRPCRMFLVGCAVMHFGGFEKW